MSQSSKKPLQEPSPTMVEKLNQLELVDEWENECSIVGKPYFIEEDRRLIYSRLLPQLNKGYTVGIVVQPNPKNDEDNDNDNKNENETTFEKIVHFDEQETNMEDLKLECQVSLEEYSPSQLIEYTFNENGPWYLSPMSLPSLEQYRKTKFENWKHMIEHPDCEAAFKRLLNIGLINRMFDFHAFPSPDNEKHLYEVKDENGKTVMIPRPVKALRIWNPAKKKYDDVDCHLEGAPKDNEVQQYWENMLNQFRLERGNEYIDKLLESFKHQS